MTLASYEVREFRGQQQTRPVALRKLTTRFRDGETLSVDELKALRDYANENGLQTLAERCRQELRTQ